MIYPSVSSRLFHEKVEIVKGKTTRGEDPYFGKPTGLWTLALLAEVSYSEGLTEKKVSSERVRQTLKKLGIRWKRAKHWVSSPDPHYAQKKNAKNG